MRNIYLDTQELEKALKIFQENILKFFYKLESETISSKDAFGRVSRNAIYAKYSSPAYHSSAMDGVMVKSEMTKYARENRPLFLKNEDFIFCNTGSALVKGYDAVIMIEDVKIEKDGITIMKAVNPWENIRIQGEDVVEKDLLFTSFHKFSSVDLSVLIASGITEVEVLKKVKLAIIPSGNEIIGEEDELKIGKIIESNSAMLISMARENGIDTLLYPIVKDNKDDIKTVLEKALNECDFITLIAGTSAGSKDYAREVLEEMGEVYAHGLSIKPGKPAILGKIGETPFVGLPGYPVSAHIIFDKIVISTILKKMRVNIEDKLILKAKLTRPIISSLKNREYIRIKIGIVDGKLIATPLDRKAGSLYSLSESDGYVIIDRNIEGYNRGDVVNVSLHRPIPKNVLENRIVSIGSHDIVLDVINDLLAIENKNTRLSSSHVGSLSGFKALSEGDSLIAPSHLLDKNGTYNNDAIKLFFKNEKVGKINVVGRRQGIYVEKGNPLGIKTIEDLLDKTMINRQRGAGTRLLFDYLLDKKNIDKYKIKGYDNEVTTHLSAALAVKNRDCDFSIGVESAAIKMDIDFIYLKDEEYQFIVKEKNLKLNSIKDIIEILKSKKFKDTMEKLGGYNTDKSGSIII
ncbi:molybdopterin biosynthesis protein [Anaerococcus sp. WCA-380-WT-2B]|uniref:Molybdopterin molybdenumtransferase n=1 Tax=Anaerococcus porci TaxID=2652269 RepID=A0A6N7VW51_9FIRM|nr:molybdopterin biosynthesis protein [Anaerococcus porci]MSS78293.1 molybdopterin biosynthesis protein [Anaerococcus porci]